MRLDARRVTFCRTLHQRTVTGLSRPDMSNKTGRLRILTRVVGLHHTYYGAHLIGTRPGLPDTGLSTFKRVLRRLLKGGRGTLIFDRFMSRLTVLHRFLSTRGIRCRCLSNDAPTGSHGGQISTFRSNRNSIFLVDLGTKNAKLGLATTSCIVRVSP